MRIASANKLQIVESGVIIIAIIGFAYLTNTYACSRMYVYAKIIIYRGKLQYDFRLIRFDIKFVRYISDSILLYFILRI